MASRDVTLGPLRMPRVIAWLIGLTLVVSIVGVLLARSGFVAPVAAVPLVPRRVLAGELWRLVTWPFLEAHPIGLLFACMMLYGVGRDLVGSWGERRFVVRTLALTASAAAVTTLTSLLVPAMRDAAYVGAWAVLDGFIVAWGLQHRNRAIRLYGIVPVTGIQIVWLTFAALGLYAVFEGVLAFVPHFASAAGMLAWMRWYLPWRGKRRAPPARAATGTTWSFQKWYEDQMRNPRDRR